MFLLTIALGSISYFQHINILTIPVLFFPIIVNILFGTRPALYLLIGTSLLVSYYAPNNYMYFFMQISAGIVAMFQPLTPASPFSTIYCTRSDILNLYIGIRGFHAHTRGDPRTQTSVRCRVPHHKYRLVKLNLSRPLLGRTPLRVHV